MDFANEVQPMTDYDTKDVNDLKQFFEDAGDAFEGIEQSITGKGFGGRIVGFTKTAENALKVARNARTAITAYNDQPKLKQQEIQDHFAAKFDLKNDAIEGFVENHMFTAVKAAEWVVQGFDLLPSFFAIGKIRSLFSK